MSTISKGSSSSKNMTSECDSSEESGWTKYFEDFFDKHNIDDDDDQKCSMSSFSGVDSYSTSFVSDAATKKLTDNIQAEEYGHQSTLKKRKKIKTALVDDAFEDTASSPIKGSKEKRNTLGESDERKEIDFNERDNDHTKLKKERPLLSSFVDDSEIYLG